MPIVVRLDRLLLERRITLTELADRVGITLANLSILKTNKARAIRFSTLEALCRELECQPAELFEFIPETQTALAGETKQKAGTEPATAQKPERKTSLMKGDKDEKEQFT